MSERRVTCTKCNGQGRVDDGWYGDKKRCDGCNGHGYLVADTCTHCRGSGHEKPQKLD